MVRLQTVIHFSTSQAQVFFCFTSALIKFTQNIRLTQIMAEKITEAKLE